MSQAVCATLNHKHNQSKQLVKPEKRYGLDIALHMYLVVKAPRELEVGWFEAS